MKRHLILLILMKMQINMCNDILLYTFTKITNIKNLKVGSVEQLELLDIPGGNIIWCNNFGKQSGYFLKN